MISFSEIEIGSGAAVCCALCGMPTASVPRPLADVRRRLKEVAEQRTPGDGVVLGGMEPFAHPDLPAIVDSAVSLGFERIRLRTDGGALSRPGNAEGVLGAGVRHFEIVVLGSPVLHDEMSGRTGLFDAVATGASAVRDVAERLGADIFISSVVPACRHNGAALVDAVAASAVLGAEAIVIDVTGHLPGSADLDTALDMATTNGIAASVVGAQLSPPYDRAPWSTRQEDS